MNLGKLAIIAGGLYLLVKNTTILQSVTGAASGPQAAPAATTPAISTPSTPSAPPPTTPVVPNQPTPQTAPKPATDSEAVARLAATGDAAAISQAETMNIRYNVHQWNWLRAAGGGGTTATDLGVPDPTYMMGVREYLARRQASGLAGLSGWGL